ncbi:Cpr49Ad [Drosophila busckii]|uniref:Cpr49Ad n=1 Tax=Drosophila busckii TaxID=30019 RepID=A0A0M5J2N2_DROBS|nr:larval cuticle protein A2B [Drosophila busckii]ALC41594.1 Cpr49Ad [Drosophila busckii]
MSIKVLSFCVVLTLVVVLGSAQRQYNQFLDNAYYRNLYYTNRDLYNRYYGSGLKNYNPAVASAQARTVAESNEPNTGSGAYAYSYETENGIQGEERAVPVHYTNGVQEQVVDGAYSFITPEGLRVTVKYQADANGYRPVITYDGVNAALYANQPASAGVVHTRH